MKQPILILLIVLSAVLPSFAQRKNETKQAKCTLAIDRAPELRGLRVGATQASVLARFPGVSVGKPDKLGVTQLRLTVIDSGAVVKSVASREKPVRLDMTSLQGEEGAFTVDAAKFPALKGVARIQLRFLDNRLSNIQIAYDDSIKWVSVEDFIETVSNILKLPTEWQVPAEAESQSEKELRCEDFVITAHVGSEASDTRIGAQLTVEDLTASKTIQKRQDDLKEKAQQTEDAKRKNFKP